MAKSTDKPAEEIIVSEEVVETVKEEKNDSAKLFEGKSLGSKTEREKIDLLEGVTRCVIRTQHSIDAGKPGTWITIANGKNSVSMGVIFNKPTHVNNAVLEHLKNAKYVAYNDVDVEALPKQGEQVKTNVFDRYSIEILPPLSAEEYNAIRVRQQADGFRN